jgi:hypothetical protein
MQTETKKVKRNYKLHKFSVYTLSRNMNRYNPSKIRYAMFMNKIIAIEAKYQPYECTI